MLIRILMFIFSALIFYIGFYLYSHHNKDFMIFKPTESPLLQGNLKAFGIVIMIISLIVLILGMISNPIIIVLALFIGLFGTTGSLLFLIESIN